MHEKVSIIIPTYKRPKMLEKAIVSALNQSYQNIEIIIVDDNGKDTEMQNKTQLVVSKYGDQVQYIVHDVNKGGSAARNTGWKHSTGSFVTFLDDDDEIHKDKIAKQVKRLYELDDSYGAVYTDYIIIQKNGKKQISSNNIEGDVFVQALARTLYMGSGSNLLVKKELVEKINGYDEEFKRNQDIEFMARLFNLCKIAHVGETLLTIHEEYNQNRFSFDFMIDVTNFYIEKMKGYFDLLDTKSRKKVLNIINLEMGRLALSYKKIKYANYYFRKVNISTSVKYLNYLIKRLIFKRSYGFFY